MDKSIKTQGAGAVVVVSVGGGELCGGSAVSAQCTPLHPDE